MKTRLVIFCVWILILSGYSSGYADILPVVYDEGLPAAQDDIFMWSQNGNAVLEPVSDQTSPEGVKFLRIRKGGTWEGWGVFFCGKTGGCEKNLSRFNGGKLEFYVSTSRDLKIEIEAPKGSKYTVQLNTPGYGWNGTDAWQKISIPLSHFVGDLSRVYSPFLATAENVPTDFSFAVDEVRWVVPLPAYAQTTRVALDDGQLMVNGKPFTVMGVNSGFAPVGQYGPAYLWTEDPQNYDADVSLLKELGVNVVRLYHPPTNRAALDAFFNNGIYVILTFPVAPVDSIGQYVDFTNATMKTNLRNRFKNMVEHWGKHPAVLMWFIGNEVNINMNRDPAQVAAWYGLVNTLAQEAKLSQQSLLNKQLVSVVNAECAGNPILNDIRNYNAVLDSLDLWSIQIYRGCEDFGDVFTDYRDSVLGKPLLLSEFGVDAYDLLNNREDQPMQSGCLVSQWAEIMPHLKQEGNSEALAGSIVFSWRDEWWKSGKASEHNVTTDGASAGDWEGAGYPDSRPGIKNMNQEWYGLVGISANPQQRFPRQAYQELKAQWARFTRGNANCDNSFDISDAIYTLNYLFKSGPVPVCSDAADANDDGIVDISDVVKILLGLFAGQTIPAPHPDPGIDPTPDDLTCQAQCGGR